MNHIDSIYIDYIYLFDYIQFSIKIFKNTYYYRYFELALNNVLISIS